MRFAISLLVLGPALAALAADVSPAALSADGVQISWAPDRLRVEVNGHLLTQYIYRGVPRPICSPLIGPGDAVLTCDWPMKETAGEGQDHPHHRSLWFGHGSVNGRNFWSEEKAYGKIVHEGFLEVKSGRTEGVIRSRNRWIASDATVVCTDERTLRFYASGNAKERLFDYDITLKATSGAVTFGDTKEGTMAVRLAETIRLKGPVGQGHIVNSAGARDGQTWGKRADWCDYYGPVGGKTVGLAIFDHPRNPHHPTWWEVQDYGLFAANPFGQHEFESLADKTAGELTIPAGKSVTFRYQFFLHEGDEKQANVAAKYKQYVK